jgi:hypothetical protein
LRILKRTPSPIHAFQQNFKPTPILNSSSAYATSYVKFNSGLDLER